MPAYKDNKTLGHFPHHNEAMSGNQTIWPGKHAKPHFSFQMPVWGRNECKVDAESMVMIEFEPILILPWLQLELIDVHQTN